MSTRFDIAVVGGGIVGSALAFGMRTLGAKAIVLDAPAPAAPSRNNFGLVWLQGKGDASPAYVEWTQGSVRAWPRLARGVREATGVDVALEQRGGLHVCLSERALAARRRLFERLFDAGAPRYDVEWLDRAALASRWPGTGVGIAGATFCPHDGHCDFVALLDALRAANAAAGIAHRPQRVDAIVRRDGAFVVDAGDAKLTADRIVIAAGLESTRLAAEIGLDVPLRPVKGHVLRLRANGFAMPCPSETLRVAGDGTILAGDSHEERGDVDLDAPVLAAIAQRTLRIAPSLDTAEIVQAWAACRVMSPDGLPIYAGAGNAFVVAAHSGVTLAAAHAFVLAPAILDGALPDRAAAFAPARFAARAMPAAPGTARQVAPLPNALDGMALRDVAAWPTTSAALRAVYRDEP
jgi:glycine/D-amino acid oxidase-like deaminating enzyme